jgi:hypothetical protein
MSLASTTMKRQQSPRSSTYSIDSHSHKIRCVEPARLGLSYAEHREMDRKVLSYDHIAAIKPQQIAIFATVILNCIVAEAPGLLDEKYVDPRNGAELIKSNPDLLKELVEAFQKREFAPIRLLGE